MYTQSLIAIIFCWYFQKGVPKDVDFDLVIKNREREIRAESRNISRMNSTADVTKEKGNSSDPSDSSVRDSGKKRKLTSKDSLFDNHFKKANQSNGEDDCYEIHDVSIYYMLYYLIIWQNFWMLKK